MIFITKCFKSTELYIASGSAPPKWKILGERLSSFH